MNIEWNTEEYEEKFKFVHKYGEDVINLIDAGKDSLVVDLGCGNGALTKVLSEKGYRVLGIDASTDMIEIAKKLHPNLEFKKADATEFELQEKADAIFSNAVFHWIDADKQEKLIGNISNQLKAGGQLVCEFGGKDCAEIIHKSLEKNFEKRGMKYPRTFYFPSIGEYAPILEKYGLRVEQALLFDRPTEQKTENGLEDWIRMFVKAPFQFLDEKLTNEIIQETVNELKDELYINGKWFVDYVRIRIAAKKETNLKIRRNELGVSQSKLAELTGIPVRTIQQYEQRQKNINKAQAEYLVRLARMLCCGVEDLLEKV